MAGTTGPTGIESTEDPFEGDVGQLESIGYGIASGAIKIP